MFSYFFKEEVRLKINKENIEYSVEELTQDMHSLLKWIIFISFWFYLWIHKSRICQPVTHLIVVKKKKNWEAYYY